MNEADFYFNKIVDAASRQGLDPIIDRLDTEEIDNWLDHDGGFLMVAFVDAGHGTRIGITAEGADGYLACLYDDDWDARSSTVATTLDEVVKVVRDAQTATGTLFGAHGEVRLGPRLTGCGYTLNVLGVATPLGTRRMDTMATVEMTNHEALHAWGDLRDRIDWHRRAYTPAPDVLKTAESKLYDAYGLRTMTTTTVDLSAAERTQVADVIAETLDDQRRFGRTANDTPHLESLHDKLAADGSITRRPAEVRLTESHLEKQQRERPTAQPGQYDPRVRVDVGGTYRHPMALSEDLIVRVVRVWSSDDEGQMAHCEILSGGIGDEEAIERYGFAPSREMDTRAWALIPVSDDPYDDVARSQGLGPLHDRLSAEDIPHELDVTGGAPPILLVLVPLDGGAYLHIERWENWLGSSIDVDGWNITKFLDPAGETFEDIAFGLTMTETIIAIRTALGVA